MESILNSVKIMLGIPEDVTDFNQELIMHINTVFMILNQIGVGPSGGFSITGTTETWDDYTSSNSEDIQGVKSYLYLKTRTLFDPPSSGTIADANNRMIQELEARLSYAVDPGDD